MGAAEQVPEQVWYMKTLPSVMMAGVLPFGVVFVELFFILRSPCPERRSVLLREFLPCALLLKRLLLKRGFGEAGTGLWKG